MAKAGLSYYQAETDRFQDIKIKRLKKRYGCEGYAVYQYIQNEIYRVEGCYIRFTDDQLFDVSEYWGIEEDRVEAIIEYCAEVELFEAITWRTKHVLTSVDIQQRYAEICRRSKKKMLIPEDIRLIELQDAPVTANSAPLPLFAEQQIDTKTGETHYGAPMLLSSSEAAQRTGSETPSAAPIAPNSEHFPRKFRKLRGIPRKMTTKKKKEKKIPPLSPRRLRGRRRIKLRLLLRRHTLQSWNTFTASVARWAAHKMTGGRLGCCEALH